MCVHVFACMHSSLFTVHDCRCSRHEGSKVVHDRRLGFFLLAAACFPVRTAALSAGSRMAIPARVSLCTIQAIALIASLLFAPLISHCSGNLSNPHVTKHYFLAISCNWSCLELQLVAVVELQLSTATVMHESSARAMQRGSIGAHIMISCTQSLSCSRGEAPLP